MAWLKTQFEKLSSKQRQWLTLVGLGAGVFGILYVVLLVSSGSSSGGLQRTMSTSGNGPPTNIGVMPPGAQVSALDTWVGTAGHKLDKYERERQEQERINKEQKDFAASVMKRFGDLEQRIADSTKNQVESSAGQPPVGTSPVTGLLPGRAGFPPSASMPSVGSAQGARGPLPPPPGYQGISAAAMPGGVPPTGTGSVPELDRIQVPALVRVSVAAQAKTDEKSTPAPAAKGGDGDTKTGSVETYLPVSFTRGVLLGGLDAPTGGQAQSNPHPVLVRLSDNSILPNRFRAEFRECFVIGAGYGDISSERAYIRTESLSCVRNDGSTLEVKIHGSIFGEDGKVGMRGRLVTKQGQVLANALLAGVVSGIGQGIATYNTTTSTSVWGTVATTGGVEGLRAGVGSGIGKALDRLAQYYIKLSEAMFPIIEIDAGREIDVVITKGVRIDSGTGGKSRPTSGSGSQAPDGRYQTVSNDDDY